MRVNARERASRLFREHSRMTVEKAHGITGLPTDTLKQILAPIDAERTLRREARRIERKLARGHCPCPLCRSGHGAAFSTMACLPSGSFATINGDPLAGEGMFRMIGCSCSNSRCPACLLYPRDTIGEAEDAFKKGEFLKETFFTVEMDGWEILATFSRKHIQHGMMRLMREYGAGKVRRFPGINPEWIMQADMLVQIEKAKKEGFDTTMMCPECGHKGRLQRTPDYRWTAACPHCKKRLEHGFPSPQLAQEAFEAGDWQRECKPEEKQ